MAFAIGDWVTVNKQGAETFPSLKGLTGCVTEIRDQGAAHGPYVIEFEGKVPITMYGDELQLNYGADSEAETVTIETMGGKEFSLDKVNHPSHYADGWSNGAEVIDLTENLSFNRGNAVKYLCRAGKKDNELEDLRKAAWYVQREIKRVEGVK